MKFHKLSKCVVFSLFFLVLTSSNTNARDLVRNKRNAFQLCSLVNMYTGSSCLRYTPYGCFCGYGQQGSTPVDDTDRCCKDHDDCYGEIHTQGHCTLWIGMFVGYTYNCEPTCTCTNVNKCARKVCECDLQLAKCLGKTSYNQSFRHYDRRQCR
ncbi:hypothetical protein ACF0H5_007857 [Mactra antiquata]